MKRAVLASLTLMLIAGCSGGEDAEFQPDPDILALMSVGDTASLQHVIVERSYDIADTVSEYGLSDATVRIITQQDTFDFADTFWDPDSDAWEPTPVEGWYWQWMQLDDSSTYYLEVAMPWGDTVTAEAMMPSPLHILLPADSETVSISQQAYSPLMVSWNPCKNTDFYMLYCVPDVDTSEFRYYSSFLFLPSMTADTFYAFFRERMVMPWSYEEHYVLRVLAVTPEYADYLGMMGPSGSTSNLSKGYGVFTGIAEDSVRVFIVE